MAELHRSAKPHRLLLSLTEILQMNPEPA